MAREKKDDRVIRETYEMLYAESYPKADFTELKESAFIIDDRERFIAEAKDFNPDEYRGEWKRRIIYEAYFLDRDRFHEIVESQKKKNRMSRGFDWIYLGAGPSYPPVEGWANEEENQKFKDLGEKINRGDVITESDLSLFEHELKEGKKHDHWRILLLYEYNRRNHPEVAKQYLDEYKKKYGCHYGTEE